MGNTLPRLAALRNIPWAALGLKKNRCGTWLSKTSDNKHTPAALGDSEKLRVKHTPRQAIPEFIQGFENDGEVASFIRRKQAGDVFENNPRRPKLSHDSDNFPEQAASRAFQSCSFSGHRQILTGEASGNNINCSEFVDSVMAAFEDIVVTLYVREVRLQNCDTEALLLNLPECMKARPFKPEIEACNAREQAAMRKLQAPSLSTQSSAQLKQGLTVAARR